MRGDSGGFGSDERVVFGRKAPAFGMADFDEADGEVGQGGRGDEACVRA